MRLRFWKMAPSLLILTASLLFHPAEAGNVGSNTGFPIPRFVTIRTSKAKIRTGPGTRYPIEWIFVRRHMPVKILAEFDSWRKIEDWEGTIGWVHHSHLSGRRTVIVAREETSIRRAPQPSSGLVARAERGVIAVLDECQPAYCRIRVESVSGWLDRSHVWGLLPDEVID